MSYYLSAAINWAEFQWEQLLFDIGGVLLKVLFFYLVYKLIKIFTNKVVETIFSRLQAKSNGTENRTKTLESLTKNIISYIYSFILIVTILELFDIRVTAILAGAGIVGLAVGFGAQGLVSDVVTGFFILLERQIDVGDEVTIGVIKGTVEVVGLKTLQVRDYDGSLHFIPNRQIATVSNHSRGTMRAMVEIKLSKDDNFELITLVIQDICKKMAEENEDIVLGPDILGIQEIGVSDFTIRIVARTANGQQAYVERVLRQQIKLAIDEIRHQEEARAAE
ncbi:mechanosensitive ion channel protein [Pradoshia eiseniae]|uniref:Mechanosensitive ion channel protein n=1 Tax=Pradoshia eiseniae TaxID=2064768 RepID=A0A2S7MYT1_9BACI|nr:mechanosensitive ion channel family protein [Pradoshia eiseniae]PQD94972.1 mechanosensitive ion channel protein [Pradoshia eiseniae]